MGEGCATVTTSCIGDLYAAPVDSLFDHDILGPHSILQREMETTSSLSTPKPSLRASMGALFLGLIGSSMYVSTSIY